MGEEAGRGPPSLTPAGRRRIEPLTRTLLGHACGWQAAWGPGQAPVSGTDVPQLPGRGPHSPPPACGPAGSPNALRETALPRDVPSSSPRVMAHGDGVRDALKATRSLFRLQDRAGHDTIGRPACERLQDRGVRGGQARRVRRRVPSRVREAGGDPNSTAKLQTAP